MPGDLVKNFPYRIKASGLKSLADAGFEKYIGQDCTQRRGQFIISNLDSSLRLYLCVHQSASTIFCPVWPASTLAFNIWEDVWVYNNSGGTVQYAVCELFYDEGVQLPPGGFAGGLIPPQPGSGPTGPTGTPLPRPPGLPLGSGGGRTSSGPSRSNSGSVKP